MERNVLKYKSSKQSGSRYTCKLTEELDKAINQQPGSFVLCKKLSEPIIRIEYKDKSIGDLMTATTKGENCMLIIKHSLYLSNITSIHELNKNRTINIINRILKSYIDSNIYI